MAKRKKTVQKKVTRKKSAGTGRRKRRSPEEMIADLNKQIEEVKQRAVAKELKQSPAISKSLAALRGLDAALGFAADEKNKLLQHALADARKPLAEFLLEQGVQLPRPRLPRGRKPSA